VAKPFRIEGWTPRRLLAVNLPSAKCPVSEPRGHHRIASCTRRTIAQPLPRAAVARNARRAAKQSTCVGYTIAIAAGWAISLIRPVRRAMSAIVQWLAELRCDMDLNEPAIGT
jgi:hypothetical protein